MLTRKLTHLEAHAIAHRLQQAGEVVAGVVEELEKLPVSQEYPELSADERLLVEAWDFGQFSPDFDRPLAKPVRAALGRICSQLALAASAPTLSGGAAPWQGCKHRVCYKNGACWTAGKCLEPTEPEPWPTEIDAQIKACALMILGICATRPQDEWPKRIEGRIRYMLSRLQPQAAEPKGMTEERAAFEAWYRSPACKTMDEIAPIAGANYCGEVEEEFAFQAWQARALLAKGK